jgi:hypothetical protein
MADTEKSQQVVLSVAKIVSAEDPLTENPKPSQREIGMIGTSNALVTLNHTLEFESDAQTTEPLSENFE